jgi:hypothetical protein
MDHDPDIIETLNFFINQLEQEIDKLILDNNVKTQQIKKLYKENDALKKKYKIILDKISQYVEELESLKKNYGKN